MEVRFENICVTARVLVGEHGRPTLLNYYSSGVAVSIDNCIQELPNYNLGRHWWEPKFFYAACLGCPSPKLINACTCMACKPQGFD